MDDDESDTMDFDDDDDTDKEMEELEKLNAVLEADGESLPSSYAASRYSVAHSSTSVTSSDSNINKYSKIETALALNRLTDLKLQRLEKVLTDRLQQCREKIQEMQTWDIVVDKKEEKFRYLNCGKPYFKDSNFFPAPENSDAALMAKAEMYDFSAVSSVPGWTVKDKNEFESSLTKMSRDIRFKELNSKMAQIRRNLTLTVSQKKKMLDECKKEFNAVSKKKLKDLALPIEKDYDWETIANKLNHRHGPLEYRALWKLFLHPAINKDNWTPEEHDHLQRLAQDNIQDWDKVAEQLGTNRTGYQCFVYYRTNMCSSHTTSKWTKEEEEYLKRLIEYYREENYIPWGRVAASMDNRTKIQIYNKYLRLIESRKGRFLPEEDSVLLNCVSHYGPNFKKIKTFLPGRSHIQLRVRYQILCKKRLSTVWTVSEDRKLIQLMANQDSTMNYSSLCKYFPGKDRVNIRARHITLVKWLKRNPNVDIAHAPRRGARRLCHGRALTNINKAVESLKNRMESEYETKKPKRIKKDSCEKDIEEAIVAQLVTEMIKEKETRDAQLNNSVKIDNHRTVSTGQLNTTNLRKILVFLKSVLNRNKFSQSSYATVYPELDNSEQEVSLVQVKSYSKKDVLNTIKVDKAPNIWGDRTLSAMEYVMPPNFGTITGCKTLIAYITSRNLPKFDVYNQRSKNLVFRDQLFLLMERFNSLFLWPMLLSNEGPDARRYGYSRKKKMLLFPNINPLKVFDSDEDSKSD